ncbi:U6 snRNA phosphodiesterase 1 isoform 2-T2 [Odontesthes bonariensis]|uniref:U6 snRNA phosphodiesterase 1 isoform X2 n=1 Tax=Odontesthes bonariensis TaxID=219752 RepID=UPI003F58EAE5
MLVGYSSSSEDEREATATRSRSCSRKWRKEDGGSDDCTEEKKKKIKTEELAPKTRLPLPGCLAAMFPDEVDPQTEDSSLHSGRVRSFKHERGNWATCVYLPYPPEEEFEELLEELLLAAGSRGLVLTPQEEFHLSLSQTVVLRHHWIQPFTQSLKASLARCKRFVCTAGSLRVYCNAERTSQLAGLPSSAPKRGWNSAHRTQQGVRRCSEMMLLIWDVTQLHVRRGELSL